jgi:hypothetical protein
MKRIIVITGASSGFSAFAARALARFQREYEGTQLGDPVKAAAVIIHIASLDEPPLRLLLGSDAVHLAEQNEIARIDADRKWRDGSISTAFEAGGGSKVDPCERKNSTERPTRT